MSHVKREILEKLARVEEFPAISIYMSRTDSSLSPFQNQNRINDIFNQAEDQATADGHNGKKVAALLAPAKRLVIDNFAWQPLAKSLSVFVSPSLLVINQVPVLIGASVCVFDRFYLEPLLDLQSEDSVIDLPASHRKRIGRIEEEHRDKSLAAPFRSLR